MQSTTNRNLWFLLYSLVACVFALGFYDPTLRLQVLDFAKVALGGVLGLLTARGRNESSV